MPSDSSQLHAEIDRSRKYIDDRRREMHEMVIVTRELIIQSRLCMEAVDRRLRSGSRSMQSW